MQTLFLKNHKAIHLAWLALIIATLIGWWLGDTGHSVSGGMPLATAGIIATAFVKVWIISYQFMELRHTPRWLRHSFDLWIVVMCVVLIGICA